METLMADLMASARGAKPKHLHHYTTYHHMAESFIADESRVESPTVTTDYTSLSTPTKPDSAIGSESDTANSPTYVPFYDSVWSSSQPTYLSGDYHDISPPSSPSLGKSATTTTSVKPFRSSFTIDSILGSSSCEDSVSSTNDLPAVVTSSISSTQLYDLDYFQDYRSSHTSLPQSHSSLPAVYWCHACSSFCSKLTDANEHQSRHSINREPTNLKRNFSSKYGYISTHVQTNYMNRVQCGLCDRIVSKSFFSKHVRSHEGFTCNICGTECATPTRLNDHMNIHAGKQPHTCKTCGSCFGDRRKLLNHSRQHKESVIPCRYCDKKFKTRYNRDVHERNHTGYRPFVCTIPGCKKAFPQKVQLKLHSRFHSS